MQLSIVHIFRASRDGGGDAKVEMGRVQTSSNWVGCSFLLEVD